MREIEQGLKAKKIINHGDIYVLREYIRKKYPGAGLKERAAILANAVHCIIDRHIQEFDEDYRVQIRMSLLKKAVLKNHYEVDACDVFRICLLARNNKEEHLETFTRWVNRQQETPVSMETLLSLSSKVRQHAGDLSDIDLDLFPDRLEETEAESSKGKEPQLVDKGPLGILDIQGTASEVGDQLANVRGTAFDVVEQSNKVQQLVLGFVDKLGVKERLLPRVLVASLVISGVLVFQPLKSILSPSFGSTVRVKEVNKSVAATPLPEDLKYKPIDIIKLRQYLTDRNSVLADEPYLMAIIQAAEEFNINPLLLFAITGQEQSFVPRTDKDARIIANNPFNVYHSWKEYNTNIRDSARIAAMTVINLSENRPEAVDPIFWINRKYAEDKNWWIGVSRFFKDLKKEIGER